MRKMLIVLSLAELLFLAVGLQLAPTSSLFWLTSGSLEMQVVRLSLCAILFVLLITRPPRHAILRLFSGLVAIGVGAWAIQATYAFQMEFMDTLAFLSAVTALGLSALELPTVSRPTMHANHQVNFVA